MSRSTKKFYRFMVILLFIVTIVLGSMFLKAQAEGVVPIGSVIYTCKLGIIISKNPLVVDNGAYIVGKYSGCEYSEYGGKPTILADGSLKFPTIVRPKGVVVIYWFPSQKEEANRIFSMIR